MIYLVSYRGVESFPAVLGKANDPVRESHINNTQQLCKFGMARGWNEKLENSASSPCWTLHVVTFS